MQITSAVKVRPGAYRMTDPGHGALRVSGTGFTLDLRGVNLVGTGANQGVGIHITDARNITLRGAHVSGCLWGIVLERCRNVTLVDCVSSHNGDLPPGTVIDESGREPEDQHGGGILLRDSTGCVVRRCRAQHQWDGIDLVRSNGNVVEQSDVSYSNNWGIHFWASSRNVFRRSRAVWCTTGAGKLYQALTGWQTYDAQAVGIDHASCDNRIEDNDLRFGGDGIFIRANEGGLRPDAPVPPRNSSDRNILRRNDCSFSPNNAIEVDLVEGTIIEDNNCSNSHYGLWLGYSRGSIVRRNTCMNDTAHAIEIENGQNGVIEYNLFGVDNPPAPGPLIYLRQNGRDRTPSGPYTIRGNLFLGAADCVQLRDTEARFVNNTMVWGGAQAARLVIEETPGRVTQTGTRFLASTTHPAPASLRLPARLTPGTTAWIQGSGDSDMPVAVELDGIPLWVRGVSHRGVGIYMPADFWDRPAPARAALRVLTPTGWSTSSPVEIAWPKTLPRVVGLTPNPARIGDTITVKTAGAGEEILLNGRPVVAARKAPGVYTFGVPEGVLASTRFNLMVRPAGTDDRASWPVTFSVEVPPDTQPHLVSAVFSPTVLHVGEVLTVRFTVRNNLPVAAALVTKPAPGLIYAERQSGEEVGAEEPPGTLHLRVTSDHPGDHDPGSWPWFFGFDRARLAPGETITVTGRIRVETPGVHEFRTGLVASGFRFLDDNAFRTRITVLSR